MDDFANSFGEKYMFFPQQITDSLQIFTAVNVLQQIIAIATFCYILNTWVTKQQQHVSHIHFVN